MRPDIAEEALPFLEKEAQGNGRTAFSQKKNVGTKFALFRRGGERNHDSSNNTLNKNSAQDGSSLPPPLKPLSYRITQSRLLCQAAYFYLK